MRYVSIDTETTALKPQEGGILSFGAVIEDTNKSLPLDELPRFHVYVKQEEPIQGSYFALQMNHEILKAIATKDTSIPIVNKYDVKESFHKFLIDNGFEANEKGRITITAAGKNFAGFDKPFINCMFVKDKVRFRQRTMDPTMLYFDSSLDEVLPDLKTCKERAGIKGEVTHDALDDALDVVAVLRKKYKQKEENKNFLSKAWHKYLVD